MALGGNSKKNNMTVKQLKSQLDKYPDTMEVFVAYRETEFSYGWVNRCYEKKIDFMEDPFSKVLASDRVLVIDEE